MQFLTDLIFQHQTVTELESVTFEVQVGLNPVPEWQHFMWASEADGDLLPPKSGMCILPFFPYFLPFEMKMN